MNELNTPDVVASLVAALILSPVLVVSGVKGLDGLRWLAKKFIELTDV